MSHLSNNQTFWFPKTLTWDISEVLPWGAEWCHLSGIGKQQPPSSVPQLFQEQDTAFPIKTHSDQVINWEPVQTSQPFPSTVNSPKTTENVSEREPMTQTVRSVCVLQTGQQSNEQSNWLDPIKCNKICVMTAQIQLWFEKQFNVIASWLGPTV